MKLREWFKKGNVRYSTLAPANKTNLFPSKVEAIVFLQSALTEILDDLKNALQANGQERAEILKEKGWVYGDAASNGQSNAHHIFHTNLAFAKDGWQIWLNHSKVSIKSPYIVGYDTSSFSTAPLIHWKGTQDEVLSMLLRVDCESLIGSLDFDPVENL